MSGEAGAVLAGGLIIGIGAAIIGPCLAIAAIGGVAYGAYRGARAINKMNQDRKAENDKRALAQKSLINKCSGALKDSMLELEGNFSKQMLNLEQRSYDFAQKIDVLLGENTTDIKNAVENKMVIATKEMKDIDTKAMKDVRKDYSDIDAFINETAKGISGNAADAAKRIDSIKNDIHNMIKAAKTTNDQKIAYSNSLNNVIAAINVLENERFAGKVSILKSQVSSAQKLADLDDYLGALGVLEIVQLDAVSFYEKALIDRSKWEAEYEKLKFTVENIKGKIRAFNLVDVGGCEINLREFNSDGFGHDEENLNNQCKLIKPEMSLNDIYYVGREIQEVDSCIDRDARFASDTFDCFIMAEAISESTIKFYENNNFIYTSTEFIGGNKLETRRIYFENKVTGAERIVELKKDVPGKNQMALKMNVMHGDPKHGIETPLMQQEEHDKLEAFLHKNGISIKISCVDGTQGKFVSGAQFDKEKFRKSPKTIQALRAKYV